jgi:pyrroline-5-carboxylate reductase
MFYSLTFSVRKGSQIDFEELVNYAATPNGMNEQAGKEIKEKRAHEAYKIAADNLLKRFMRNL